jgi:hypothetical protein
MKLVEILGNLRTYISNEEHKVLEMVKDSDVAYCDKFNERDFELATGLVKRGVLTRSKDPTGLFFNLVK